LEKSTSYEAPHYAVSSNFRILIAAVNNELQNNFEIVIKPTISYHYVSSLKEVIRVVHDSEEIAT
jgi:hypothetical protein